MKDFLVGGKIDYIQRQNETEIRKHRMTPTQTREYFEKEYLVSQLKKFNGNISKTARFVGMERSALHRKLKLLGVKDFN